MHGEYREVDPPSRIVATESFDDDWTGGETVNTTTFDEVGGITTVTVFVEYASAASRDGALATGMEAGHGRGLRAPRRPARRSDRRRHRARYRRRADRFEALVAAVDPDRWDDPSPCAEWRARDVVGHIVDMHGVMLRPAGRELSPAPSIDDDPRRRATAPPAPTSRRCSPTATLAASECDTPMGRMTRRRAHRRRRQRRPRAARLGPRPGRRPRRHDRPRRGRADVADDRAHPRRDAHPRPLRARRRRVRARGAGAGDASKQDRLLGKIGRDPAWVAPR